MFESKLFMVLLVIVVGAVLLTLIDIAIGLDRAMIDAGVVRQCIHKTAYILQGVVIAVVLS